MPGIRLENDEFPTECENAQGLCRKIRKNHEPVPDCVGEFVRAEEERRSTWFDLSKTIEQLQNIARTFPEFLD
jgi:hypothetical protein